MCREVWPFCIRGLVSQTPWPAHRWWWWSEEGSPLGWNNTSNVQTGAKPQLNWWLLVVYRLATFRIVHYRHRFWQKVVWCGIYNSPLLTSIVLSCIFFFFSYRRWGGGGGGFSVGKHYVFHSINICEGPTNLFLWDFSDHIYWNKTDMPHIFKWLMMQKVKLLSSLELSVLFQFKNK